MHLKEEMCVSTYTGQIETVSRGKQLRHLLLLAETSSLVVDDALVGLSDRSGVQDVFRSEQNSSPSRDQSHRT